MSDSTVELTDRDVNEAIHRALGHRIPTHDEMEGAVRAKFGPPEPDDLTICGDTFWFTEIGGFHATYRPDDQWECVAWTWNYCGDERDFASRLIPALDARGLLEKYAELLLWSAFESEASEVLYTPPPYQWMAMCMKASLSLRARAALTVLENDNG